ncbi:MAG: hypothetical protein IPM54_15715 [Polyangiaceae bacterium]|nr:hypothetical protein [Polyangiaceae bacterium]
MSSSLALFYRFVLRNPERVEWHLDRLYELGRIDVKPNLWQVSLGVAYMLHRMVFRPSTIGIDETPVRRTFRARLWQYRPLRFPFLLWQKAIDPIDLTGLSGSMERKHSHLVGAYHPGDNALYDLECMTCDADALAKLREDVVKIIQGDSARARFFQDLTVYEGYHPRLLQLIDRAMAGDFAPQPGKEDHPDTTLRGFLRWCAAQPDTPEATFDALLQGTLRFEPKLANDNG